MEKSRRGVKKGSLHSRNLHKEGYDFDLLSKALAELVPFISLNPSGEKTIDFSDPEAVLCLNRALLTAHYKIDSWRIPKGYLCPPVPGRADYIHYLADLLASDRSHIPKGKRVHLFDVGTGAGLIYPILGTRSYGWQFTASDIDPLSIKNGKLILETNGGLSSHIKVALQKDTKSFFTGIIKKNERYDLTMCNPPFHSCEKEAKSVSKNKWEKLGRHDLAEADKNLNFGGQKRELWCPGGELAFVRSMIKESQKFSSQVCWFTSLISKNDNLPPLKTLLKKMGVIDVRIVNMTQGQKISRFIAWSWHNEYVRKNWGEL